MTLEQEEISQLFIDFAKSYGYTNEIDFYIKEDTEIPLIKTGFKEKVRIYFTGSAGKNKTHFLSQTNKTNWTKNGLDFNTYEVAKNEIKIFKTNSTTINNPFRYDSDIFFNSFRNFLQKYDLKMYGTFLGNGESFCTLRKPKKGDKYWYLLTFVNIENENKYEIMENIIEEMTLMGVDTKRSSRYEFCFHFNSYQFLEYWKLDKRKLKDF